MPEFAIFDNTKSIILYLPAMGSALLARIFVNGAIFSSPVRIIPIVSFLILISILSFS